MASEDSFIRTHIRLSTHVHRDMQTLIPWGMRRNVLEAVLTLVLDAVREDGIVVAGAILDGQFKLVRVETGDDRNSDNDR